MYTMADEEYKKRIQAALHRHAMRTMPKPIKKRKKTNSNPEGEFVLKLKAHIEKTYGWSIDIVEAKGVYNEEAGRYLHGKTRPGFPDMVGNMLDGTSVWIEAKAPGKRKTISIEQRDFLIEKIDQNCFGICCDSILYFEKVLREWKQSNCKKAYLLKELPELAPKLKAMVDDDSELFEGF